MVNGTECDLGVTSLMRRRIRINAYRTAQEFPGPAFVNYSDLSRDGALYRIEASTRVTSESSKPDLWAICSYERRQQRLHRGCPQIPHSSRPCRVLCRDAASPGSEPGN